MTDHQRSIRTGTAAILCAVILRLGTSQLPGELLSAMEFQKSTIFAQYLQTGRQVRSSFSQPVFSPVYPGESPAPTLPTQPLPEPLPDYRELPQVNNVSSRTPQLQQLLEQSLSWQLRGEEKTVLILSTHTTESYTKNGEAYTESAGWRTLDEGYNMLSIGDRVEQLLENAGIRVLRDRQLHDYPSYNGSYAHARQTLTQLLQEHPSVMMVLDLHRDAADAPGGGQMKTALDGCARLMLVMGAGFDRYSENLALALKLTAQLERQRAGITRPIQLRNATFNQDLSPGALLVEVGAAGDTHDEALKAAEELARAIIVLAGGTAQPDTPAA